MDTSTQVNFASGVTTLLCWEMQCALQTEAGDTTALMAQMATSVDHAITMHGGVEIAANGRAMGSWAMFTQPAAAVAAAFDVQCAFAHSSVGEGGRLRVRLALHTGSVGVGATSLPAGPTLIRGAGLLSIVHAEQTLLSDATRQAPSAGRCNPCRRGTA